MVMVARLASFVSADVAPCISSGYARHCAQGMRLPDAPSNLFPPQNKMERSEMVEVSLPYWELGYGNWITVAALER